MPFESYPVAGLYKDFRAADAKLTKVPVLARADLDGFLYPQFDLAKALFVIQYLWTGMALSATLNGSRFQ